MKMNDYQLNAISKQYEAINDMIVEHAKVMARNYISRGQEVPPEVYKLANTNAHDFEMEEKLRRMTEDPVAYFSEARKKAKKDAEREMREEIFRPFKMLLDWILRRR